MLASDTGDLADRNAADRIGSHMLIHQDSIPIRSTAMKLAGPVLLSSSRCCSSTP
jgi:hypothetical protein